jgi:uncharacterized protein (DUF2236 family)
MVALYTVVHGTKRDADRVASQVRAVHERVAGVTEGREYSALDPALQLWVHSTLVDTGLVMYETFVGRLAEDDRQAFYAEMKAVARVFGIPPRVLPRTLAAFRAYQGRCLESDELVVTDAARAVAATVLEPPLPLALRPAARVLNLATVGLLPPQIRERYGLGWNAAHATTLRLCAASVRRTLPLLPARVRLLDPEDLTARRRDRPLGLLAAFAR